MNFLAFIRNNARWLAGGFLLTFFSSYGQTFFISLSSGHIRVEYGLSHGQFGTIYMLATLASAATLTYLGQIVDKRSPRGVTFIIVPILAFACVLMAFSQHIVLLLLAIYLLRLFGQGMMSQNAFTAVGRWFVAQRGRATSLTAIGVNAGEASFPLLFVLVAGVVARASVGPAESLLTMSGNQNICAVVYGATLALNVILNVFLIPLYGLWGAAISTAVAMACEAAMLSFTVWRRLGIVMIVPFPGRNNMGIA